MNSAFEPRRRLNAKEEIDRRAEEAANMAALLSTQAGRWILRYVIERGDLLSEQPPQFNNRDYRAAGRREIAREVAQLVKAHGSARDIAEIIVGKENP